MLFKRVQILLIAIFCCAALYAQPAGVGSRQMVAIGFTDTVPSKILGENRVINIYLPDDYSPDSSRTYPVIYLLDGGEDEDFVHIVGLVKFFTTPWINRFPGSIVVGITNINRRRDFTFAVPDLNFLAALKFDKSLFPAYGGSEKFISFIEQELQPFMALKYKTGGDKTLIGESLGGLLATEILIKKPNLFSKYIIVSPSLWWGKESLLSDATTFAKKFDGPALSVFIAAPGEKEDERMYHDAVNLASTLKVNKRLRVRYDYLPAETHATVLHQAVYDAFKKGY